MKKNNVSSLNFAIEPPNPPDDGILFVDHEKNGRSGSMGDEVVKRHFIPYPAYFTRSRWCRQGCILIRGITG